jgi:hypothetical protein
VASACYYSQILMKLEFFRLIFEKYWNIKFDGKPSSEGRVVPCGRTDVRTDRQTGRQAVRQAGRQTDRQTDRHMTKLIVAFRNIGNAPRNLLRSSLAAGRRNVIQTCKTWW